MSTTSIEIQPEENILQVYSWREKFLHKILITSAIGGLFALIPTVARSSSLILQSFYISIYVLLVTTIIINFPYRVKVYLFLSLPLLLGLSSLLAASVSGNYLFFFLAFVTLSTVFINPKAGFVSTIITEIIIFLIGYLILYGIISPINRLALQGDLTDWLSAAASQFLISFVIISAFKIIYSELSRAQNRADELTNNSREIQSEMENRVVKRTEELSQKNKLLIAAALVAHETATIQNLDKLLNRAADLIADQFACYHVGIYLMNQREDYVNLQAASSEGGKRLLERSFRFRVGTEGTVGYAAADKKPRISLDVGKDATFFDTPELPETRSELSLPLIARGKVVGVLDLHSSEVTAYKHEDLDIFQSMADQLAVTINNVRELTETELVISQLENLSNQDTRQSWKTELMADRPIFHYSATGVRPIQKSTIRPEQNVLEVPLTLRGQRIGNILLQRSDGYHRWTVQEETVAAEVAAQAALALENIRLVEHTRDRANREQLFAGVTAQIRESLDLDIVLRTTAREVQKALKLKESEVRLILPESRDDKILPEQTTS